MSRPARYLSEITPAGRIAGYTSAACLVIMAGAFIVSSFDELTCSPTYPPCDKYAPAGVIIAGVAGFVLVFGVVMAVLVRRRAVSEAGTSGYTTFLSFLFAVGVLVGVALAPTFTCPAGMHLDPLAALCISSRRRFDATSWLWLKAVVSAVAVLVAATLMWRPRWVVATAPVAAAAWFIGLGWLLAATVGRNVKP